MASEALQILNLSPIPELSEMELSTVLEQLSSISDLNGDVTDRNVEDILREAEELIDMSTSFRGDSVDSKNSLKLNGICNKSIDNENDKTTSCSDRVESDENLRFDGSESVNCILNISIDSEDFSQNNAKSESKSSRNEVDSSNTESSSARSAKSLTNHIQSALDSLRECSKKIEEAKNSPHKTEETEVMLKSKTNKVPSMSKNEESEKSIINHDGIPLSSGENSENVKFEKSSKAIKKCEISDRKSGLKETTDRNKNVHKSVKGLNLNESIKTLNCFERLYRGKPGRVKIENKRLKAAEKLVNDKKTGSKNVLKIMNPSRIEALYKEKKKSDSLFGAERSKSYDSCYNDLKRIKDYAENLTDEDISFEKCLRLLNEESESQSNGTDMSTFNYNEFAEKVLSQCNASVSALQGEVENLKSQLKRKATNDTSNLDSDLSQKFWSQENLIQMLKEENSKLFKEIEEIKGQLKMVGSAESSEDGGARHGAPELVEKLRTEVENLRRSLVTAHSETNGISRLEEQFSMLKQKYDVQIGKLEGENKKLKEMLGGHSSVGQPECGMLGAVPESTTTRNTDVGVNTEDLLEAEVPMRVGAATMVDGRMQAELTRSVSLESCRPCYRSRPSLSYSCENVDAATSPIRSLSLRDTELCSVSVQCEGELDVHEEGGPQCPQLQTGRRDPFKEFHKLENKENLGMEKRGGGKARPALTAASQALNSLKQKKKSEHENQLMVTLLALRSEVTAKDRDCKKLKNDVDVLRNQIRRLTVGSAKSRSDATKKCCHVGTQTIGCAPRMHEAYDPTMFQVSRELEHENEELRARVGELEKLVSQLKDKRVHDLQILQKLHEEEIDKLASRLNTQTALTNHLHSLLSGP